MNPRQAKPVRQEGNSAGGSRTRQRGAWLRVVRKTRTDQRRQTRPFRRGRAALDARGLLAPVRPSLPVSRTSRTSRTAFPTEEPQTRASVWLPLRWAHLGRGWSRPPGRSWPQLGRVPRSPAGAGSCAARRSECLEHGAPRVTLDRRRLPPARRCSRRDRMPRRAGGQWGVRRRAETFRWTRHGHSASDGQRESALTPSAFTRPVRAACRATVETTQRGRRSPSC